MSAGLAGLRRLLEAIAQTRVCVVGDVLLDVFTRGHTDRVCPDAPALVVHERQVTYRASGAALAAQPLRSLGADVCLVTVLGDDDAGRRVRRPIGDDGTTLIAVPADRPTPCKNRIIASHPAAAEIDGRVLLRLDREETADVTALVEAELIAAVCQAIGHADAVLLSDYAKGVCTPALTRAVIDSARAAGIPVVVDPKHSDPRRYTGATVLTPNLAELTALTGAGNWSVGGAEEVRALAGQLRAQAGVDWVVATRAAAGLTALGPGRVHVDIPAYPGEVMDVAGAGDVLAGVLAATLGTYPRLTTEALTRAAVLASLAAGLSLRQVAHKRVTADELLIAADHHELVDRFVDMEVQRS
jgi:D-beta-D-heptose 7-phosphate kinase / D-beta-D-heptose 1-phosphate adenosyltransferase